MIAVLMFLLLSIFQFSGGFGLLRLSHINLQRSLLIPLAMLTGVGIFSWIPFMLQLLYIPLTRFSVFASLLLTSIILNIPFRKAMKGYKSLFTRPFFKINLYEIPFLLVMIIIVFVSTWRCFYFPPTPRDLTSGSEAIAEYAVKEHTMINSVFTVNMESTNNPFKPPFVTSLQIVYKMAGFPFGQVWLTVIFISFLIFLYHALNATLHRIISGIMLICFVAIPEMFAYTFMALFDYSNAVYFFLSTWLLIQYFKNKHFTYLVFAALMMGMATYARNETLILACFFTPVIIYNGLKNDAVVKKILWRAFTFLLPSLLVYILCVPVYLNHYLPVLYNVTDQVNQHLLNLSPLFTRFKNINAQLIFSSEGIIHYSYFIFIFLAFFLIELIVKRHFTVAARNWLYAILIIYTGLAVLGYLLPLMDLDNTTKRGLFKLFPLMLLYMANNDLLINFSAHIAKWERSTYSVS